jgi:putative ABC transport system permease protein
MGPAVYAQLTFWSLRHRPWRRVLTAFSVALTVAVLTAFFSVRFEIRRVMALKESAPYQRLWLKPRNLVGERKLELPIALKDQLQKVPGIAKVSYATYGWASLPDETEVSLLGFDIDSHYFFPENEPTTEQGRQLWRTERSSALVSAELAKQFHLRVGSLLELPYDTTKLTVKVADIVSTSLLPGLAVVMHYEQLDELKGRKGLVTDYYIALEKTTDPRPVIKAVDELTDSYALHLISEDTMLQMRGIKSSHVIPNLLGALGLIMLLTTALGIANSTMISVRERRSEFATFRVIGVRARMISMTIIGDSMLVCAIGGAIGGAATMFAMRNGISLSSMFLQNLKVSTFGLGAAFATTLAVSLVGSAFAAWRAVRAPLSVALRDVG